MRVLLLAACAFAWFFTLDASAQSSDEPLPPWPTVQPGVGARPLDGWLETKFAELTRSCVGGSPTFRYAVERHGDGRGPRPATTIPDTVITWLYLLTEDPARQIYVLPDTRLTRLFTEVFSQNPEANGNVGTFRRFENSLTFDPTTEEDQLPNPAFDVLEYRRSCVRALAVSGSLSSRWRIPRASADLRAAAELRNETFHSLSMVSGRFDSPVLAMLSGTLAQATGQAAGAADIRQQQFLAAMLIWNWYQRNPTRISARNYVLAGFDGVAIYQRANTSSDWNTTANVVAAATLPGTQVNADLTFKTSREERSRFEQRGIGVNYRPRGPAADRWSWDFEPLPAISFASEVAVRTFDPELPAERREPLTIWNNEDIEFDVRIADVPASLCTATWDLRALTGVASDTDALRAVLRISEGWPKSDYDGASRRMSCVFKLEFAPAGLVEARNDPFQLTFSLAQPINATNVLQLPVRSVPFARPPFPSLRQRAGSRMGASSEGVTTWSLTADVTAPQGVSLDDVGLDRMKLICGSSEIPIQVASGLNAEGRVATAQISVQSDALPAVPDGGEPGRCTFSGEADFRLRGVVGAVPAPSGINVNLSYRSE